MADEPFNRNGVYMSAEIVRWSNVLELKPGTYTGREGPDLFYIRGYPKPGMDAKRESLLKEHGDYLAAAEPKIVVRGGCFSDDGKQWQGSVMVVRLPWLGWWCGGEWFGGWCASCVFGCGAGA